MTKRARFVLFGDSLTEWSFRDGGWGARLADAYARKADVFNRGYSGYNTRWALYLLHRIFPCDAESNLELATVLFGPNDAVIPTGPHARQYVPVEEYKQNLEKILEHLSAAGVQNIILITPPPVNDAVRLKEMQECADDGLDRSFDSLRPYADACKSVKLPANCRIVDLWSEMASTPNWEDDLLSDGLHLSPKGNQFLFQLVFNYIQQHFPRLNAEKLREDFPLHGDVDHLDPSKTFSNLND